MLDLVRSCGLVFTATITRMLSKMMGGQVRALKAILMLNTTRRSGEIFSGCTIGKNARPQLIIVRLTVVTFIFLGLIELKFACFVFSDRSPFDSYFPS